MANEPTPLDRFERRTRWLILLGMLGAPACQQRAAPPDACPPCAAASRSDLALQTRIEAQWQSVAPQLPPQPKLDFRCLCFGAGASISVEAKNIYLADDWELGEQTARAVHLASHRHQPPWLEHGDETCAARVDRALDREAEAHALELEVRRALGVTKARYPFEADYFAAPTSQRRQRLRDYFVAHPTGDGVVPGFAASYAQRCH